MWWSYQYSVKQRCSGDLLHSSVFTVESNEASTGIICSVWPARSLPERSHTLLHGPARNPRSCSGRGVEGPPGEGERELNNPSLQRPLDALHHRTSFGEASIYSFSNLTCDAMSQVIILHRICISLLLHQEDPEPERLGASHCR